MLAARRGLSRAAEGRRSKLSVVAATVELEEDTGGGGEDTEEEAADGDDGAVELDGRS